MLWRKPKKSRHQILLPEIFHCSTQQNRERDSVELKQLLDAIFEHYGTDFRDYAYSSLKRRVKRRVIEEKTGTISGLQKLVLANAAAMDRLLTTLTIHVTAMFRDPDFYLMLREKVLPVLRTYPFIRIWVAGCSTGEEVYSLAILLNEVGRLYSRCRIYATDLRESVLNRARMGIFPLGGSAGIYPQLSTGWWTSCLRRVLHLRSRMGRVPVVFAGEHYFCHSQSRRRCVI
jgi:chemotaxis methyl-accepting protein methylase